MYVQFDVSSSKKRLEHFVIELKSEQDFISLNFPFLVVTKLPLVNVVVPVFFFRF